MDERGHVGQDRLIEVEDQAFVLETAGILVSTHLWYVWTEIAIEHEWQGKHARGSYQADRAAVTNLEDETKASLISITSVTHGLDALQNESAALDALSEETLARWEKRRPKASTAVYQTLRETFRSPELGPEVERALDDLYRLRNEVVHQRPASGEIVQHPALGIRTTPATARYTVERATQAVDLMFRILISITAENEDSPASAQTWARTWRSSIVELLRSRDIESIWPAPSRPSVALTDVQRDT
jgi:hypothetical protein